MSEIAIDMLKQALSDLETAKALTRSARVRERIEEAIAEINEALHALTT